MYTFLARLYPTTNKCMYGECEATLANQDRYKVGVIHAHDDGIKYSKQSKEYTHPPFIKYTQTMCRQKTEHSLRAHTLDG